MTYRQELPARRFLKRETESKRKEVLQGRRKHARTYVGSQERERETLPQKRGEEKEKKRKEREKGVENRAEPNRTEPNASLALIDPKVREKRK